MIRVELRSGADDRCSNLYRLAHYGEWRLTVVEQRLWRRHVTAFRLEHAMLIKLFRWLAEHDIPPAGSGAEIICYLPREADDNTVGVAISARRYSEVRRKILQCLRPVVQVLDEGADPLEALCFYRRYEPQSRRAAARLYFRACLARPDLTPDILRRALVDVPAGDLTPEQVVGDRDPATTLVDRLGWRADEFSQRRCLAMLELLVEKRVGLRRPEDFSAPLRAAASRQFDIIVQWLLDNGADARERVSIHPDALAGKHSILTEALITSAECPAAVDPERLCATIDCLLRADVPYGAADAAALEGVLAHWAEAGHPGVVGRLLSLGAPTALAASRVARSGNHQVLEQLLRAAPAANLSELLAQADVLVARAQADVQRFSGVREVLYTAQRQARQQG